MSDALPPVGTYWTSGTLLTSYGPQEAYATCARCGAIVNVEDRHDAWHDYIERDIRPAPALPAAAATEGEGGER